MKKTRQGTHLVHGVVDSLPSPRNCYLHSCLSIQCVWTGIWALSFFYTMKIGTGLSLPVWTLHLIAGVESHLVDSGSPRVPVTAAFLPFSLLVGCSVASSEGSTECHESPNLWCCLGIHNSTRHILDKKGLALQPSGRAFLFPLFCTVCCVGNSFTTSSGSLWGKVYWASNECGHETSPQSLEQAVCVASKGL